MNMNQDLSFGIIFLILALVGALLIKAYYLLPAKELKRRALLKDSTAAKLYKAVSYGSSLKILLWLYLSLCLGISFSLLARALPLVIGLLIIAFLTLIFFLYLPLSTGANIAISLTRLLTPIVVTILSRLEPVFVKAGGLIKSLPLAERSTGLYEKQDLVELMKAQRKQSESRFTKNELAQIMHILKFDDKSVGQFLTPRKKVKTILASDVVGPILIDDIHKSHQSFVLVKDSPKGDVIGTLAFTDVGIHSTGLVENHMNTNTIYLNENDRLGEVIKAFLLTNHSLFIVVNDFNEYVGVITINKAIDELMGQEIVDGFSAYESREEVAHKYDPEVPIEVAKPELNEKTSVKDDGEVIE
jgi:CBS domain containing-hemolysin-like protein